MHHATMEQIDNLITREFSKRVIPGLAIGIVEDNRLSFFKGLGFASLEQEQPIRVNTVFRLASISKIITTMAVLQLSEKQIIDINDPVNMHLSTGKIHVKSGWPDVTIKHLLTHRSGIGELFQKRDAFKPGFGLIVKGRETRIPPLSTIHEDLLIPEIPAGTKYAYSNIAFSLLGYMIEQVTGTSFRDHVMQSIVKPLGMANTDFIRSDRVAINEATGYKKRRCGKEKFKQVRYLKNIIMPAGNLYSTIEDMSLLASCLLNWGSLNGVKLLEEKTVRMAWKPHYWSHPAIQDHASIGLCFHLYGANGMRFIEHTGATRGFTSAFTLVPSEGLGLLVFSNIDEIFRKAGTLWMKNRILQELFAITDDFQGDGKEHQLEKNGGQSFTGFYGPNPGILTNTRIIATAGDYKVKERNGDLYLSSFYGNKRKGVKLIPRDNTSVFQYKIKPGNAIAMHGIVAFNSHEGLDESSMSLGFHTFTRKKFMRTFRFKVYCLIIALSFLFGILAIIIILR